jgi:hypothetical protein
LSETEALGVAKSTRELYERHQASVACAACHDQMDGIGFALEAFDGVGRFRTLDTTQGFSEPINTAAELTDSDVDRTLTGASDLSQALSESAMVRQCFTRQAFRFFFGQMEESVDLPAIVMGDEHFVASDSLSALTDGLFSTSNTFQRRRGEDL